MTPSPHRVTPGPPAVGCRRLALVWLVLVLAVFAFENGLHSVHHADEREGCAIATALSHVPVVGAPVIVSQPRVEVVGVIVAEPATRAPSLRPLSLDQGRAPPPRLAV